MTSHIALYDSGMGGLSVMHEVYARMPACNLLYLADTAYCPYGPRPTEEVRERARVCTNWLVDQGARLIVIACNTASSAALDILRDELPVPVIGMEPGVKPAVEASRTRRIGILATSGTLGGSRFNALVQRYAINVIVQTIPCHDLVLQIERGDLDGPQTRDVILRCIEPFLRQQVDTIVLGCTHFHFIAPLLARIVGPEITIISTAGAVARQVERVAFDIGIPPAQSTVRFATTGVPHEIAPVLTHLWGTELPIEHAELVHK